MDQGRQDRANEPESMSQAGTEISQGATFRGTREALLARAMDEPDLSRRLLATLSAFRLLIASALLIIFIIGGEPRPFGDRLPTLFSATTSAWLV